MMKLIIIAAAFTGWGDGGASVSTQAIDMPNAEVCEAAAERLNGIRRTSDRGPLVFVTASCIKAGA